ncbi:hypothetical protein HZH66_013022 [Vespula vulgaris]|uniref:Uncharacterized protein n=1 Tax=Vespula vulgaris TaxID=7454 RepID=A0A834MSG8_VESVU|nr:hypothetical protein HZH66_013022 [Vespula vulgaris]
MKTALSDYAERLLATADDDDDDDDDHDHDDDDDNDDDDDEDDDDDDDEKRSLINDTDAAAFKQLTRLQFR